MAKDHEHAEGQGRCSLCPSVGPLALHARCHPGVPPWAWLEGQTITFICAWPDCGKQVAQFKIIPGGN